MTMLPLLPPPTAKHSAWGRGTAAAPVVTPTSAAAAGHQVRELPSLPFPSSVDDRIDERQVPPRKRLHAPPASLEILIHQRVKAAGRSGWRAHRGRHY